VSLSIPVLLAVPVVTACVVALPVSPRMRSALSLGSAGIVLTLAVRLALAVAGSGRVAGPLGLLACEGLGALLAVLIAFVAVCASLFASGTSLGSARGRANGRAFHPLFQLFVASMLMVVLSEQLALTWVALAMTTLFSAFLVAYYDTPEALEAAWKYVVLTTMGAVIALLGLLILYWALTASGEHSFTWGTVAEAAPRMPRQLLWTSFLLVLVGAGTKAGLAPMHTWLPDAHSQAPAPVCALLSGVETSTALYVVLRLGAALDGAGIEAARTAMLAFGIGSLALAALVLVQARDLKRLLAYSTVEHMGIVLVAAGIGGGASFGAAFQLLAHALAKSFAFLTAGTVGRACGSHSIRDIRGLASASPWLGLTLLLAALGITGAPPTAVFLSEMTIVRGGLDAGSYLTVAALVVLVVVAFCAVLHHVHSMVFAPSEPGTAATASVPPTVIGALALAAAPLLILGLYLPTWLQELLARAAASVGGGG